VVYGKSFIHSIAILAIFFLLPFMSSCSDNREDILTEGSVPTHEKFYLGLLPEQDIFSQKARYAPLVKYVADQIGMDIEIRVAARYGSIIDDFGSNGLDAAFLGSFTGALAIKRIGVEPLVRPLWLDGTSTYSGMIFVRKDSKIQNADDMKGKRFAFVDKATTAGWLLPLHYFRENGINDYRAWFSETYFAGTHEDAIYDVLNGMADIGAAKNTVFNRLAAQDARLESELKVLARSLEVPACTLAVRSGLDYLLKTKLKNTILQMKETRQGREILHEFGAQGFVETFAQDYEPVFKFAREVELDFKKYNNLDE